ncbi:unnamed protein product [Moneuplotes crassus]|uniref:Pre-mRNA-splicing factor SYF1 n=3 Tax=Euplotes crassus TaxID=5936 RepID=A0AAD1Y781_EUPCR|nr:unnamed protein product [Moneuplotes crassus]
MEINQASAPEVDLKRLFKAPDTENHMDGITDPYSFRSWWNAIHALDPDDYKERAKLYYRSLYFLPGSYKLWYNFLQESKENCKRFSIHSKRYEIINGVFEYSLSYMNKMPRIWLDYCKFLGRQKLISKTRETYDRALNSLPLPQHNLIWIRYLDWVKQLENLTMIKNVYKRYLKFSPNAAEEYIDILLEYGDVQEAAEVYLKILDEENYNSKKGLSQYQLWMQLCELISKHPDKIRIQNVEEIIRHGIKKYSDEVGRLWICLADYNSRKGNFEKTREIFEEALANIVTARDFSLIFDAYINFEETIIANDAEHTERDDEFEDKLDEMIDKSLNLIEERKDEDQLRDINKDKMDDCKDDDYQISKLENLLERRPFLLSNTNLRQNPSNVYEWLNRVKLYEGNNEMKIQTYLEAIHQIDPSKAYGKAGKVWVEFATFYEENGDLENANQIYLKAISLAFKNIDELAMVYCSWAEMHFRHKNYESALLILHTAVSSKRGKVKKEREDSLHLSTKLWYFYVDLQENFGTFEDAKKAYERMMDLKVASPQTILNYCAFLERHYYFEESFRIYERSLSIFDWPHCYDLWVIYLSKFIERYSDTKIERTRDLFDQVLIKCPSKHKKKKLFFYMYADFEENFGLINHASEIYDRATKELEGEDRIEVFNIFIAKTAEFYGITKTREILYERAFDLLEGRDFIEIGLKSAKLERKLGEIDRARSIYQHLSQFCNPKIKEIQEKFWNVWDKFEIYHGNEDTYKEFMKYKRTVEMRYSISVPFEAIGEQIRSEVEK